MSKIMQYQRLCNLKYCAIAKVVNPQRLCNQIGCDIARLCIYQKDAISKIAQSKNLCTSQRVAHLKDLAIPKIVKGQVLCNFNIGQ